MTATDPYVVRMHQVHKTYWLGKVAVHALQGITLAIARRQFAVVVGPSGSGKTTLLNLIGCIDQATQGEIEICREQVGRLTDNQLTDFRAKKIGFIFQNFNLIPVLSAYENIEYPLLLTQTPKAERQQRVREILAAVGIEKQQRQRPSELSGGQRQRVAIARALVKGPELVLADEPTANLDSRTGREIIDLMHAIQDQRQTTFIFSSHDQKVMEQADVVFAIQDGSLRSEVNGGPRTAGEGA